LNPASSPASLVISPMPIESLSVPPALDGRAGLNRAIAGRPQIAADNDLDAVRAWLSRFDGTTATFDSYRKEAERLLLWSLATLGKPISSLTHEDCLRYQRFLLDPQPAATWVAGGGRKHPRTDARWRPFYGPLSPASQRQAIVILNAMFSWLVQAGYLAGNPLSLSRQRTRHAAPRVTRYLEPGIWQEVKNSIAAMPRETVRDTAHAHRVRWLFTLLYLGGLRIAEVGNNTMGQFFMRRDSDGMVRWWLTVRGKGDKERLVPATREMMTELSRYRQHLGLSALPSHNEDTPLCCRSARRSRRAASKRVARSHALRCTPSSNRYSPMRRLDYANETPRRAPVRTCWKKRPHTGYGTLQGHTWPIRKLISGSCATQD
jgi:site-specific recombinase XerD